MKIIYFGTAEFAVAALKALANSRHDIACVVTQPPKKQGRDFELIPSAVESFALTKSIEVFRFDDVNSEQAINLLKARQADLFVVAAFGQILKQDVLNIPKLYPVNIHASLLPVYRGASPIQRAILNGDKKTGITVIIMNQFLDKGDIIAQREVKIEDGDDIMSLTGKLSRCSAELILKAIDKIEQGSIRPITQDEEQAVYAPKLTKQDGLIDWNKNAQDILNQIRACKKWPSAYTYLNKKGLKILSAEKSGIEKARDSKAGEIICSDKDKLIVSCRDSGISIKELQLSGKNPLKAEDFLRGHHIPKGAILG
jgi:methionyl-tRNA formyltransferase